jgi:hypothetical protein
MFRAALFDGPGLDATDQGFEAIGMRLRKVLAILTGRQPAYGVGS